MRVSFLSFDSDRNKVSFQSEASQVDNGITFEDKSYPHTNIQLTFLDDSFVLTRTGNVTMYMAFQLNKDTKGTYKNVEGLEFDFYVHTKSLNMQKNKIKVEYDMLVDQEVVSSLTFQVTLFKN